MPCTTEQTLESTLANHSHTFNKILEGVPAIESTLVPKIDTLRIDKTLLQEDHKKWKEGVNDSESTLATLRPAIMEVDARIKALQKEVNYLKKHIKNQEGRS
ncbi:hypothetical protein NDU88_003098 [Pleurodeles waltl]|uniref:Uncharacterized protein n=1 Tax=Pleurodeles waltl TaxID=8319 RepID=A0AAV7UD19_PLEWA|nr:hypothetical protein NDU88_003098 [Pleurodeles waltl]